MKTSLPWWPSFLEHWHIPWRGWLGPKAVVCLCLVVAAGATLGLDRLLQAPWLAALTAPESPESHEMRQEWISYEGRAGASAPSAALATWVAHRLPGGTPAPDFMLPDSDGRQVRLASFRGRKPVVLVFGSFRCGILTAQLDRLRGLAAMFKGRAKFLFVYISATSHPLPDDLEAAFRAAGLEGDNEVNRLSRIRLGLAHYELPFPCVIDKPDRAVETAYDAWPSRLVVVGSDGRITLDSGRAIINPNNLGEVTAYLMGLAQRELAPDPSAARGASPATQTYKRAKTPANNL